MGQMGSMRRMGPMQYLLKIILARLTADYGGWPRIAVDRRGRATIGETGSESLRVNESGKNAQKRAKTCSPLLGVLNLELWTERHPPSRFALRRGKGPSHPSVPANPCGPRGICPRSILLRQEHPPSPEALRKVQGRRFQFFNYHGGIIGWNRRACQRASEPNEPSARK